MSLLDRRCEDVLDLMPAYLADGMPVDERTRLETHMAYCPGCAEVLGQLRATIEVLRTLPVDSIEPRERDRLLAAFRTVAASAGRG